MKLHILKGRQKEYPADKFIKGRLTIGVSLINREHLCNLVLETMSEGFVVQDPQGKIIDFNHATLSILGLSADQLIDHTSFKPMDKNGWGAHLPSGEIRLVLAKAIFFQGEFLLIIFSDVTSKEIRKLNKLFDVVLSHIPSMIFAKDFKNNLSFSLLNKAGEKLLGLKQETLLGKNDYDFFTKEQADFFTQKDREVFINRMPLKIEKEAITTPYGIRYLQTQKVPTYDENGEPYLLVGISNDITDELKSRSDLELERAKSLKSAKLASLGEMAAGIAHEINNPLSIIFGSLELLPKFLDSDDNRVHLEYINKAALRISKIMKGLRKFSRTSNKVDLSSHSLLEILQETIILTEAKANRHQTKVSLDCQTTTPVLCNELEIEQVFINLLNNAIDAVKTLKERWVKISVFDQDEYVILRVTDSGSGIPDDLKSKVFEPFFTTKPVGEGTGLGLSISKGILDDHKASISVLENSPNTSIEIRFLKNA